MKPSPFQLFHMYYLGLTPEFKTRFYNIHAVARHFGVDAGQVEQWLDGFHLRPELFRRIDFNVAKAHGKAQEVGLFGTPDDARDFARRTFEECIAALATYSENKVYEDLDYDDIWGDGGKES